MADDTADTGKHDTREIEFELLSKIHDKIEKLERRMGTMEEQILILVQNVDTVHDFQRTFAQRLYSVEKHCIDQPLHPVLVSPSNDNGE